MGIKLPEFEIKDKSCVHITMTDRGQCYVQCDGYSKIEYVSDVCRNALNSIGTTKDSGVIEHNSNIMYALVDALQYEIDAMERKIDSIREIID